MKALIEPLLELDSYKSIIKGIQNKNTPVLASGVVDSQKIHLTYAVMAELKKPALIITHSELRAKEIFEDMRFFIKDKIKLYPSKDIIFYSADVRSLDIIKQRFEIVDSLMKGEDITVVLSIEALFDRLVEKDIFSKFIINLSVGDEISIHDLAEKLVLMGYERTELVESVGQFAVRGGIIDLYTSIYANAIRIEFWGDEIDSIRLLDQFSQRSIEKMNEIRVFPMRELVYNEEDLQFAIASIEKEFDKTKKAYEKKQYMDECKTLSETIGNVLDRLREQRSFDGVDKYIQFFYKENQTFLDYLPKDTIVFVDEPTRISGHAENVLHEFNESIKNRILKGYLLPTQMNMVFSYAQILSMLGKFNVVLFTTLTHTIKDFIIKEVCNFSVKSSAAFKNRFDLLIDDLNYWDKNKYRILILAGVKSYAERIAHELREKDFNALYFDSLEDVTLVPKQIVVSKGSLNKGFEYLENNFVVVSGKEIFGSEKQKKSRHSRKKASKIENFTDLTVGDHIVHSGHGIGVFRGIEQIVVDGLSKDYLKLEYAGGGNLYISTTQMDQIQKYIGGKEVKIKLNKLGGADWVKAKAKTKSAVLILAKDLVELYAKRQATKGYKYSEDMVWQTEFEEKFPYEETEDQLTAIIDVKTDMESDKVMDRLICGDVGYGKTEVAIRAAFKAVQEGKQVAYLVPTTILAQQHYNTFVQRMKDYPIIVELLSRFRTPKQIKASIANMEKGLSDIVIGTHRLLSKDVVFKDLGLVIVDEEQRFGVSHKEKLKQLKGNVDVLTLTATPIPRTLHMSLTGIRDMSVLSEPPEERRPVQTYVMEYNEEFVEDAINRELARDGQVYFLHNRVRNISEVASRIQKLVPGATVQYAHGQMSEHELEDIMMDFIEGNIDVLVCTTIIETGLDISNVNTIIIQDADLMGLSQLYQLRGRVGRSNRLAYAYLMYRRDKVLEEIAEKRLQTIREFTEFGSGFKIAMRDLEIRGAGNLIGSEQHGHMDAVGYDMYCKLLSEAVQELKGEIVVEDFETTIDISIDAYIPSYYIENELQKLEIYKKISTIQNDSDYFDIQEEIEDRYGTIPRCVQNLLEIALLKAVAHSISITTITEKQRILNMAFKPDADISLEKLGAVIKKYKNKLSFSATHASTLNYRIAENENPVELMKLKEILEQLK